MSMKTGHNKTNSNALFEGKDLLFIWKLVSKNLAFLIIIPLVAFGVGKIYVHRLPSVYGIKAQFLLKSNETYDYQDPIYKGLGAYGAYMDVQNQMRIVQSRDLIGEVVDKIHVETSYYIIGRLKRQEVFGTLPFKAKVEVLNDRIYEVPVGINIVDAETYNIQYEVGGSVVKESYKFDEELKTNDFRLTLEKRYSFDENLSVIKDSDYEIVFHSRNFLINQFQSNLSVENIEFTSVIDVSLEDGLEERGKMFLDTLTSTYVNFSKRIQLEVNQNTINNIQKQIDTIEVFIREKEDELLNYKDQNSVLHVVKEEDEFFADYVITSKLLRELNEKKNSVIALDDYLKKSVDERLLPPSFYIEESDQYLADAIGKIRTEQMKLELKTVQQSPDNPNVINLKNEIGILKSDVKIYLMNLLKALNRQIETVESRISTIEGEIKKLPKSAQDILNIQRELDVNTKMYVFLLEKKTNTLIARAGIIPQVQVIEKPTKLGVLKPDKVKLSRLFVLGGFILAFLLAVVRKLFFEKIENTKELGEVTSLPIVGGVSQSKRLTEDLIVTASPKSQITEEFRRIRSNLNFLLETTESRGKKLLISSFFPGEGKTFCSCNLAALIARSEKKVIIIDLDLHRPKIHKVFSLDNSKGVTNIIIGKSDAPSAIHKDVIPNLDILTAGPNAPNPSELILRSSLKDLITWAEQNYEYVIIDSAPFGLLNDAIELLAHADGIFVIMNTRYTSKRGIQRMEEILKSFDKIHVGLILNGIRTSKVKYYYSQYAYRYSYGYNYGYDYDNYYHQDN